MGSSVESGAPAGERAITVGDPVGEYIVECELGRGAFGTVYRAIHPVIGKQVAVKVLSLRYSVDPSIVSRFVAEARAVNQIGHRHIIDIFSFGELPDGRRYYVMEYLEGSTLERELAMNPRMDVAEALAILEPLARALDAAHAKGIAHRDLKPANVLIAKGEEGAPFPKLLDFGIAKLMDDNLPRQHHTGTGALVGTPQYMSPEQCRGEPVDHRTDHYSFGVMAYQMLTGRLPFEGTSAVHILSQHLSALPPPPSLFRPDLPEAIERVLLALLEKDRERRPFDLKSAVTAMQGSLEGARSPGRARANDSNPMLEAVLSPPTTPPPSDSALDATFVAPSTDKRRIGTGLALVAAGAIALGFLWWNAGARGPERARGESVLPAATAPVEGSVLPAAPVEAAPATVRVEGVPTGPDANDRAEALSPPPAPHPKRAPRPATPARRKPAADDLATWE